MNWGVQFQLQKIIFKIIKYLSQLLIIKKKLKPSIKNIEKNLYTKNIPDPDILIRTGNTHRLSNFLLWQLSYTEIYFVKKFWPDFTPKDYSLIINNFKNIKRKFGKVR